MWVVKIFIKSVYELNGCLRRWGPVSSGRSPSYPKHITHSQSVKSSGKKKYFLESDFVLSSLTRTYTVYRFSARKSL